MHKSSNRGHIELYQCISLSLLPHTQFATLGCLLALFWASTCAGQPSADDIRQRAEQLWQDSPVIVCHTHPDPDDIPASVRELAKAGITTAVFDLTIDDGDWRSRSETYDSYSQADTRWRERFESRLAALEQMEDLGEIVIVKRIADIPKSTAEVKKARDAHRVAIIISSEGSNQIDGPPQLQNSDVANRDSASKSETLQSIQDYYERGWRSTALAHQLGRVEVGHKLLRVEDGAGLNDYGRFIVATLQHSGILVDLPHMPMNIRNEILDIAATSSKPVMISHDNPRWLFEEPGGPETLARIARSGHGTGLVGVHSYKHYHNPFNGLESYALAIDEGTKAFESLGTHGQEKIRGDEHLALGIDWFCHKDMDLHDWAGRSPDEPLQGLVALLMSPPYNYSDQQIKNILGENIIRMLRVAWDE